MKISTAKLKELVTEALRQDREQWDREEIDFAARQERHRQKWQSNYSQDWAVTAHKILEAVDNGKPVTPDMFPHADGARTNPYYLSDIAVYTPLSANSRHEKQIVSGKAEYKAPESLLRFQALLDLVEDDTLTTSALKDHGLANLDNRLLQYINLAVVR